MNDFYHDQTRNLLVYPGYASAFLQQALPELRQLNGSYFAVPRTLRNSQILSRFNYPVMPVMTDQNYDWPIPPGKTPMAHQKMMANFDVLNPRSFNLSDPGTMKTQAKLWAADFIMKQFPPGKCRALIVAPLTILETVWAASIFNTFFNRRSFEILHGDSNKRRALLAKKPDFGIINFEGVGVGAHTRKKLELDGFSLDLLNDNDIQIVIVDEADAYCDAQTKRHRLARLVFNKREWLLVQTGTPTGNAPTDAYGIAKLVNNAFGKSFTMFRDETMIKVSLFKWVPKQDGYERARKLMTPAIRFAIEEVWKDAPELTTQQRMVQLTPDQEKAITSLKRDLQIEIKSGQPISAVNEGAARQKYMQIAMGAVYDENHKIHTINAKPRYDEIDNLIRRSPHKVLVFAGLTSVVEILHKHISKNWKAAIINGDVSQKERTALIRAFESDPEFKVMVMDPQPTAHGINEFVVADTVIWAGPTEKTRLYIQANRRAHRPGQKYPVTVYQIVATRLEQEIFRRLETNTSLQGVMLEAVRKGEL